MATGFNSPTQIADGAIFFLSDTKGRRQLFHIESCSVNRDGSTTVVTGPAGVIGFRSAAGGITISVTTNRAKGVAPEADWHALYASNELIRFDVQILGGARHQFTPCKVSNANDSIGNDGSLTTEVSLVATQEAIIQPV